MVKKDIYDIIIWVGMVLLILYVIGKLTGVINSPEWINLMPIITITFIVGAFYQKAIVFMNQMYKRTDYLKNNMDNINNKLSNQDNRLNILEFKKKPSKNYL